MSLNRIHWIAVVCLVATMALAYTRVVESNRLDSQSASVGSIDIYALSSTKESPRRTQSPSRSGRPSSSTKLPSIAGGAERYFWTFNRGDETYQMVRATLVYNGRLARIWVDNRDTGRVSAAVVGKIARALDTAAGADPRIPDSGIIENEQAIFGLPPTRYQVGGKDDFLMTDLKNGADGLIMLGCFQTKDQYPADRVAYSNQMNLLYIDSKEGLENIPRLLGTIAHEYQHLLHYARNPKSETFLNEAASELAALLNGYKRPPSLYLANTNVPLFRWNDGDPAGSQIDYQRGLAFGLYLFERFGGGFIDELVGAQGEGVARIQRALVASGADRDGTDWKRVLLDFATANYLQSKEEPRFGYQTALSKNGARATVARFVPVSQPMSSTISLEPYGSVYHLYDNPGSLRLDLGGGDYRVRAILYRGSQIDVQELASGGRYELGTPEEPYDKVVLAYVSLSSSPIVARWSLVPTGRSSGPAIASTSVRDEQSQIAIESITPQPIRGSGRIRFTTSTGGRATLELYDERGTLVGTLLDNEMVEAGAHDVTLRIKGVRPGAYILKLSHDGAVTARTVRIEG